MNRKTAARSDLIRLLIALAIVLCCSSGCGMNTLKNETNLKISNLMQIASQPEEKESFEDSIVISTVPESSISIPSFLFKR